MYQLGYPSIATGPDGNLIATFFDVNDVPYHVYCPDQECDYHDQIHLVSAGCGSDGAVTSSLVGSDGSLIWSCYEPPPPDQGGGGPQIPGRTRIVRRGPPGVNNGTQIGWVPGFASVTLGADGLPLVSTFGLKHVHPWADIFELFAHAGVDNLGDGNFVHPNPFLLDQVSDVQGVLPEEGQTSITVGHDGMAWVSYFDYTNGDLKVLRTFLGLGSRIR